ncbi:Ribosomal RNA small subunit methyltransferase A [Azospirillaceae bacterium]
MDQALFSQAESELSCSSARPLKSLPPLRDVVARWGIGARKSLGQHFLFDLNVTRRIVRGAGDLNGVGVIEIGPGPGGLTRALLESSAREVIAIERDVRCVQALADLVEVGQRRLRLLEADALAVNVCELLPSPRAIVANLPYNIATPLLIQWLRRSLDFKVMVLMFQKEVAQRLCAQPGKKEYGRLSILTQWRADIEPLFTVAASAFTPPPKVESMVVKITPKVSPFEVSWPILEAVTAAAFGQRRKMLRSSLKPLCDNPLKCLEIVGIDPTRRAESLSVDEFLLLARAVSEQI